MYEMSALELTLENIHEFITGKRIKKNHRVISYLKIWRMCTGMIKDSGVVAYIATPPSESHIFPEAFRYQHRTRALKPYPNRN